jgi:adenylate kinase
MKMIFVSAPADFDRKALLELAFQRSKARSFVHIDFDDVEDVEKEMRDATSALMTRQVSSDFYEKLEKMLVGILRKQTGTVIISGYASVRIPEIGYAQTLPEKFFSVFKPDLLVLLEMEGAEEPDVAENHELDRHYCTSYSLSGGSMIRIIKVKGSKMLDAVKELSDLMKI